MEVYHANILKRDLHAASAEVFEKAADKHAHEARKLSATASTSPYPAVANQAARTSAETAAKADDLYDQADQFRADAKDAHEVSQEALAHDAALSPEPGAAAARFSTSPAVRRSPLVVDDGVSAITNGYTDDESVVSYVPPPLTTNGGRRYGSRHYRW